MSKKKSAPFFNLPPLVTAWAFLNLIIFLVIRLLPAQLADDLNQQFIFVPTRDLDFFSDGHFSPPYQIITYGFLHHDSAHVLFNIAMGVVFSKMIYQLLGMWRWALVFVSGLLGGAALHIISSGGLSAAVGIMGASAGVAAWLGASLFLIVSRITMPAPFDDRNRALFFIIFFIAINFLAALVENNFIDTPISNAGHLGGLLAGFLTAWAVMLGRLKPRLRIR
ncbi:MAG: rhomboid family intramembrane serine protease [Hydrotalea sp.]|nr:rhomboid family intramembrane serine protease [Hydrotalea sp.]